MKTTVSFIITKLQNLSTMSQLKQSQALIFKTGNFHHPILLGKLIFFASLHPSGNLSYAQNLFDDSLINNPFIYNTMIRAYSKSIVPIKALNIYNRMHYVDVKCDDFTYVYVIKACARVLWCIDHGDDVGGVKFGVVCKSGEVHARVMKCGFEFDHVIQNSLMNLYSQCGLVNVARIVFDEMLVKSVVSWNIMVSAYDQVNDFEEADSLLESMNVEKNVVSWNSLIARYVRLGNVEKARKVFDEMPCTDAVSWNSMINGYIRVKEYDKAFELFDEMQNSNVEATEITLTSVLGACAETGAIDAGKKIHELLILKKYKIEGYLGNALIDMYAKSGNLGKAWEVFKNMKTKHICCWNAMIVGLAIHGYSEQALELFSEMEAKPDEAIPNRVTFIGILIACSHKGFVEKGREYFKRMIDEYKIVPDMKHYGCMVDLLSRWGFVNEAYGMIKTMPFKANSVVLRTILAACKLHNEVELAEETFAELSKEEDLTDGDFVLLSNIYAEAERWGDVECLRDRMIRSMVSKKLGSSNVETR